ncbi:VPS9 domain-containing protein 1 isoform X2 [Dromiciops gliroides]|uniref:VPS9 domain-containing protein 1 isoform X2 n=1 Tax=Dromiciops gliroides TaxID=33562 RepID=UPI001CC63C6B|nr:VPS9 domain-containing protein 1 isoform X2 [Dromiciops gliroides]
MAATAAAAAAAAVAGAAGDCAMKPLQSAMKLAHGAIELDAGNRPLEAYLEYLKSIHYISQVLLEEAGTTTKEGGDTVTPDTPKMLKLAEQCLERAKSTAAKLGTTRLKPAIPAAVPGHNPASRHRRVYSDEGGKLCPFLPPEIFQKLQVVESQSSKKELTPLEEASLQNQKLKASFEARMARLNPSQAVQKTSLTLSLQRQMMENLVIAKAREETLQRKMEERRLRLQEAANRRFCSRVTLTPEEQEQRALYAAILEYEQDHDWPKHWKAKLKRNPNDLSLVTSLVCHLLSFPDHPVSQLLKKLQCAVYNRLYPVISKHAADSKTSLGCPSLSLGTDGLLAPGSRRLRASQSLHCMFTLPEPVRLTQESSPAGLPSPLPHPCPPDREMESSSTGSPSPLLDIAPGLLDKDSSFEDLEHLLAAPDPWARAPGGLAGAQTPGKKPTTLPEQLKSIVKDVHNAIDRLLSLTLLAFEGLNTTASKDRCLACIEEPFFSPLWAPLLALYRIVYQAREAALSRSMELCGNMPPSALGIASKLFPQEAGLRESASYPYCTAVQELGLMVLESCPQKKLECIVRALRKICECAEEYCRAKESRLQPSMMAIGADDLLPILSYVVLKSNLPQLVSECAALEEFIHEGYLIGEEGYCLTSLQSALSYVELLPCGALVK